MKLLRKVQKTQDRPQLIFEETGRAVAMLRDLFNPTYETSTLMMTRFVPLYDTMFHL